MYYVNCGWDAHTYGHKSNELNVDAIFVLKKSLENQHLPYMTYDASWFLTAARLKQIKIP